MCGITGLFSLTNKNPNRAWLENATQKLQFRGPDNQAVYTDENIGLGHARLSIIDTSSAAHQPFWDISSNYCIIFNGEIFNYQKLKKELAENGIQFRTTSDTEVLLYQFILFGKKCLDKLNGFFAFAIYNKQENSVFIARDRFGVKPLYYAQTDDFLFFGSEMKAICEYPISKEMDMDSVAQYFQLNYIPPPHSIFRYVKKLQPGHCLEIKAKKIAIDKWYNLPYLPGSNGASTLSYPQQCAQLESLLEDAVRLRLIADVPLGAFLSGGIDSSVIVALAKRHTPNLNTFSIGFQDEGYFDETPYANLVAKHFDTNHTVFKLRNDDLLQSLQSLLDYSDEPFADSSALLVNILSKETRKHVTVALSGDGGDELFAGYNKHYGEFKMREGKWDAKVLSSLLPLWKFLPKSRNGKWGNKIRQFQRFAESMNASPADRYWNLATFLSENEVQHLLNNFVVSNEQNTRKSLFTSHMSASGTLNDSLFADVNLVLPGDMLTKVDSMSMLNSLEVRTPFLDYRVVEFAFSLPVESKINNTLKKRIVQDTFRSILPSELYNRPKKGFEVPLLPWFKKELKSLITDDLLSDSFIRQQGFFNPIYIQKTLQKLYSNNPGDTHALVWALIVFQHWYKKNIL
ncbi:MAG: asparagine synthase (glutamine-hydrolyzing) [Bacteroidetes bacterium]|nr:asparagine synthase (glutamine-hydrolyzing) [Bacteroidota bacterium]